MAHGFIKCGGLCELMNSDDEEEEEQCDHCLLNT
jgi:hypothetical protein